MNARMALFLVVALAGANAQGQTCNANIRATTPTDRFVINAAKGTVLDKATGLTWKQCAEGQSGADCAAGAVESYTWADALAQTANSVYAGYQDWRLPNVKELESLVERKCYSPAINLSVFPGTPPSYFWTSSLDVNNFIFAWSVDFTSGIYYYCHSDRCAVRLVRSAP